MFAVIFDTETNGKIKNWNMPLRNNEASLSNFPRVTQLAWEKVNLETGEVVNTQQSIIKPDGWTVPVEKFFIDNNMSTERCEKEGVPLPEFLPLFADDLRESEIVVAHNMNFDLPVIGAEMFRYNISVGKQLIKVCTMAESTEVCKIPPFRHGKHKWPKLVELYKYLFDDDMEGNHEAMSDVIGCRKCFIELIKLNHIILDRPNKV